MSTREIGAGMREIDVDTRETGVADADVAPRPSTSLALVPLPREAIRPVTELPAQAEPGTAHRWFYGSGYTGLAMILCAAWAGPASEMMSIILLLTGAFAVGIGGLGVLIHVCYRPRMDKLRKGLGAVAAVALTAAAALPIHNAAVEVNASRRIAQVEPLAALVSGSAGIRVIAVPSPDWVELNGFSGDIHSNATSAMREGPPLTLAQVLERDGISRGELVRLRAAMKAAEVSRVEAQAAYLAFDVSGDVNLLYVRPGQVLPQPGTEILYRARWRTKPLGGGWYLFGS